jgi:glycerophosphoryl diester phosphodiesterase
MSKNFAHGLVSVPPSPATSGLTLTVETGQGERFEAGMASLWPYGESPTPDNAEIVEIESVAADVLTLAGRAQEGTTARTVAGGWNIRQGLTAGELDTRTRPDLVTALLAQSLFYAAHRGGGDEAAEHTERSYFQGLSRGYEAIEVSAQTTADGVPVCLHDVGATSLARTTTMTGELGALPLSAIAGAIVDSGVTDTSNYALGAGYTALHEIPLLGPVLARLAHRTVIFLEPKATPTAILDALAAIPEPGKTIIWKYFRSGTTTPPTHAQTAASMGIRSWVYLNDDDTDDVFEDTCSYADAVGIEKSATDERIEALIAFADAAGIPVMVHPVRRRQEVERLTGLGVQGIMCTNPSYAMTDEARVTSWPLAGGVRLPGDFWALESRQGTYVPASSSLTLGQGSNGGIVIGSMCPVPDPDGSGGGYRIAWEMKWATLPSDLSTLSGLYLAHDIDDAFIFQASTNLPGYHVFLRANGTLGLSAHVAASGSSTSLGTASTTAAVADTWMSFNCDVTATQVIARRLDDVGSVTASNTTNRGGYFGLFAGSSSVAPQFRNVTVAEL